ncbi:MAG: methyltransferase, partial [Bacteroidales bacterium]|nr:methyltransferase [Bacteroidales bacterium]
MEFRCKQFALNHSASTMKVGTDSILLASFLNEFFKEEHAAKIHSVLDVGTGCGIIALCCAQIFRQADILGIDTDKNSVDESNDNFRNSPWKERLSAKQISFQDLASEEGENFDLIVSNPPYFTNSLLSADERKNSARHNHSLPTEAFVLSGEKLSSPASHIAV